MSDQINDLCFDDLSKEAKGELLNEMVQELAIETQLPIHVVINLVAKYYKTSERKVRRFLRLVDSDFVANNNVVIFHNEKPIFRTSAMAIMWRGLSRLKPVFENESEINYPLLKSTIEEYFSK